MRRSNGTWAMQRGMAIAGVVAATLGAAACADSLHLDPASNAPVTTVGTSTATTTSTGAGGATGTTTITGTGGSGGSGTTTTTTTTTGSTTTTGAGGTGGSGGTTTTTSTGQGGGPPVGCKSNSDCPAPTAICDAVKGECVECLVLSDCAFRPGTVCSMGQCACPTQGDTYCDAFGNQPARCVDLDTASLDCGTCNHACFGACAAKTCVDKWEPTSTIGAPSARQDHAAVWTGTHLIVWGGQTNGGPTNTGGMYDLATGTWASTSTVNAPPARTMARAVWTGSRMIVWGGQANGNAVAGGGSFDPATNTWTSLATDGQPSARYHHSLVWAAPKYVIAWGGTDGSNDLADGARYDPATDTWLAMASGSGRREHTATWTGANGRMIVFGGSTTNGFLTEAFQYDPTGDAWTPLQPNGVSGEPLARSRHTAAWTGSELLVWGGIGANNTVLGNGSKFKVQETSWTPMNEPSPSPRQFHTAVWLSNKMIVWGGTSTNGVRLDSGAMFDPVTNKWDSKPLATAPSARAHHIAVATDKKMVIWGGETNSGFTNTGGVFTP